MSRQATPVPEPVLIAADVALDTVRLLTSRIGPDEIRAAWVTRLRGGMVLVTSDDALDAQGQPLLLDAQRLIEYAASRAQQGDFAETQPAGLPGDSIDA